MAVLDAVQSVLSILLMISIGYVLSLKGWFSQETPALFSRLVVKVSLPALMISNLLTTFDRRTLLEAGIGLVLPMFVIIFLFGIGRLLSGVLKVPSDRRGFSCPFLPFQIQYLSDFRLMWHYSVNKAFPLCSCITYQIRYYSGPWV